MAKERMPWEIIRDLAIIYDKLSDTLVLAKLREIPPLPDEDDPAWNSDSCDEIANHYLALWQVVGHRQLREAIPLIF